MPFWWITWIFPDNIQELVIQTLFHSSESNTSYIDVCSTCNRKFRFPVIIGYRSGPNFSFGTSEDILMEFDNPDQNNV